MLAFSFDPPSDFFRRLFVTERMRSEEGDSVRHMITRGENRTGLGACWPASLMSEYHTTHHHRCTSLCRAPSSLCCQRVCHTRYVHMRTSNKVIERNQVEAGNQRSCLDLCFSKTGVYMQSVSNPISPLSPNIFFGFNYFGHQDAPLQVIIFPFIQLHKAIFPCLKSQCCTDAFVKRSEKPVRFSSRNLAMLTKFLLIHYANQVHWVSH